MKLCPKCGAQLADEVKFCTQCGVPMTTEVESPVEAPAPEVVEKPEKAPAAASGEVQQPVPEGTIQVPDPFEAPLPTIEPDDFIDLSGFMDPEPLIIPGNALPLEPETIEVKEKYYFKDEDEEEEEKKKRPILPLVIVLILALILFLGAFAVHILGDSGEKAPGSTNTPGIESSQPTTSPSVGDFFGETDAPAETTPAPTETVTPEETDAPEETTAPETQAPETQAPETQKPEVVRVKSSETGSPYTVTIESGVYVRTGPSTDYEICGVLSYGDTADVVRVENKWAEINYQGYVSYVYAGYLTEGEVDVSQPSASPEPSPSPDSGTRYYMGEAFTADYVLADSSTRLYTEEELSKLSTAQLKIARNEIYARYGRKFTSSSLQSYFDACSWYKGTIEAANFNDATMVNDIERANANLMLEIEQKRG